MEEKAQPEQFVYQGRVYVRPIGRGIVLLDLPGEPQLEDVLLTDTGYYQVDIQVSAAPSKPPPELA